MPRSPELGRFVRSAVSAAAIGTLSVLGSGAPAEASPVQTSSQHPETFYTTGVFTNRGESAQFVLSEGGAAPQAERIYEEQTLAQAAGASESGIAVRAAVPTIPWQDINTGAEVRWGSRSIAPATVLGPLPLDQDIPSMRIAAHPVDLGDTPIFIEGQSTLIAARFSKPGGGEGLHYGAPDPSRPDKKLVDVEVNGKGEVTINIWTGQLGDATKESHTVGTIADYDPMGTYDLGLLIAADRQSAQGLMGDTMSDPIPFGGTLDAQDRLLVWGSQAAKNAGAGVDSLVVGHIKN
jgi:hypothetical protein